MSAHPNKYFLEFLHRLNEAQIQYAILRDDPTQALPLAELDVLIDDSAFQRFAILARKGQFHLIRDGYLNPGKKVFLRFDGERTILLDVHLNMVFRGLVYLDGAALLRQRIERGGYFYLGKNDHALALLLHNMLAKRAIQEKHRQPLIEFCRQESAPEFFEKRLKESGVVQIIESIKSQFAAVVENAGIHRRCRSRLRKKLRRQPANFLRLSCLRLRYFKTWVCGEKRGLLIAFIGPDGAGKSSSIAALQQVLQAHGFACRKAYMGPWGGSILKLRRIFFWLNPGPYRADYKAFYDGEIGQKPGPLTGIAKWKLNFRSAIYYAFLWIEMKTRWFVRVLPGLRQGKIVLADRYIYDILTGYKNRPMDYQQSVRSKICNNFPRPDIGVLLACDSQIIFSRKPQLSQAILEHSQQAYQKIAMDYGCITLRTDQSIEQTIIAFRQKILPLIAKKMDAVLSDLH